MAKIRHSTLAVLAALMLLLGACGDDGDSSSSGDDASGVDGGGESDGDTGDDSPPAPSAGSGGGTATFDGGEVTIARVRCFFEEQPRAGLGGVFTHSLQADGTNADGTEIVIDMTRAVSEDGEVSDDISYDIGDPFGDDFVGYGGGGPEGTIDFGDDSASATDLEMQNFDEFGSDPLLLSFDLSC